MTLETFYLKFTFTLQREKYKDWGKAPHSVLRGLQDDLNSWVLSGFNSNRKESFWAFFTNIGCRSELQMDNYPIKEGSTLKPSSMWLGIGQGQIIFILDDRTPFCNWCFHMGVAFMWENCCILRVRSRHLKLDKRICSEMGGLMLKGDFSREGKLKLWRMHIFILTLEQYVNCYEFLKQYLHLNTQPIHRLP